MADPTYRQEPSMDDILASIRKIIGEDDRRSAAAAEPTSGRGDAAEEDDESEPLELSEAVGDDAPASGETRGNDVSGDAPPVGGLMSDAARSSAAAALDSLARAAERGAPRGRSVEQLVMEQMEPMLGRWLDEHLPDIVERVVEREVRYLSQRLESDDRT